MHTIKYTTPKGRFVVILETGRTTSAPGEFLSKLENRPPAMVSLPDRLLIMDAPCEGFRHTYATPDFVSLEAAIRYADHLEANGDDIARIARRIGFDFNASMDQLATLVDSVLPDDHEAYQALVYRKDWTAPAEARDIVRRVFKVARDDISTFAKEVDPEISDPEVMDAWESADPAPGVRWGRDHRIALTINAALYHRGIHTGDWSWLEWMRVAEVAS